MARIEATEFCLEGTTLLALRDRLSEWQILPERIQSEPASDVLRKNPEIVEESLVTRWLRALDRNVPISRSGSDCDFPMFFLWHLTNAFEDDHFYSLLSFAVRNVVQFERNGQLNLLRLESLATAESSLKRAGRCDADHILMQIQSGRRGSGSGHCARLK